MIDDDFSTPESALDEVELRIREFDRRMTYHRSQVATHKREIAKHEATIANCERFKAEWLVIQAKALS